MLVQLHVYDINKIYPSILQREKRIFSILSDMLNTNKSFDKLSFRICVFSQKSIKNNIFICFNLNFQNLLGVSESI